jgi:7-carboxy-7-deazaguanine synthase
MRIAEIFHSIQGEGMLAGTPSSFVRTSGCNLRCVWCDTPYTSWAPEGAEMTLDEITAAMKLRHVVVTGGEPMIAAGLVELTRRLRERAHHITVETAGTVYEPVACDLMSISPKLKNSTPAGEWGERHERRRVQLDVLRRLTGEYEYQLKFVVAERRDVGEARELVELVGAAAERVVLMPEGVTREAIAGRAGWVAAACVELGWRYSPRLQIDIWGNRRGV